MPAPPDKPPANETDQALEAPAQPVDRLEASPSGRARCRGCGQNIAKGELRFGEAIPNPFADGVTTIWFHASCAAHRRPEKARPVLEQLGERSPELETLLSAARIGEASPRLARIALVERAPSGRAKCRHCQEPIGKDLLRFKLEIFQDARFQPIGYIHLSCQTGYFGVKPTEVRLSRHLGALSPADIAEVSAEAADPRQ